MKIPLTHKGWFGVCPVYLGNVDSESPFVHERHWAALPLFMFSELMFAVCALCMALMNPFFEPKLPIRITGELPPGRTFDVPDGGDDDHGGGAGGAGGLRLGMG